MSQAAVQVKTVNVIEFASNEVTSISSLTAFPDTEDGNRGAEALFVEKIREYNNKISDADTDIHIEDGYYENNGSTITIVHSC